MILSPVRVFYAKRPSEHNQKLQDAVSLCTTTSCNTDGRRKLSPTRRPEPPRHRTLIPRGSKTNLEISACIVRVSRRQRRIVFTLDHYSLLGADRPTDRAIKRLTGNAHRINDSSARPVLLSTCNPMFLVLVVLATGPTTNAMMSSHEKPTTYRLVALNDRHRRPHTQNSCLP